MDLVKLTIKGISYSQAQSGAYALILSELDGNRNLPVIIGAFEAQSIAIGLEKEINPPRPITHDLMAQCFERFKIIVKQIIIHKLVDGVFYSSLICERDEIKKLSMPEHQTLLRYPFALMHPFLPMRIFWQKHHTLMENSLEERDMMITNGSRTLFRNRIHRNQ